MILIYIRVGRCERNISSGWALFTYSVRNRLSVSPPLPNVENLTCKRIYISCDSFPSELWYTGTNVASLFRLLVMFTRRFTSLEFYTKCFRNFVFLFLLQKNRYADGISNHKYIYHLWFRIHYFRALIFRSDNEKRTTTEIIIYFHAIWNLCTLM